LIRIPVTNVYRYFFISEKIKALLN
jgi:hypothetical protein